LPPKEWRKAADTAHAGKRRLPTRLRQECTMVIDFKTQPPTPLPVPERPSGTAPAESRTDNRPAAEASGTAQSEAVRISDQGRSLQRLEQQLPAGEVREGKVAEIRRAIDEGRYQPNPEQTARKMLSFERMLDQ
jgi:flagellar biosynthesis anti-sigma factor FlgM